MDDNNIKLFNTDQDSIVLPNIGGTDATSQQTLISEDINKDISGEMVKTIRVKEDTEIDPENFVLDLSNIDQITASQKEVVKSLISRFGTTSIYLYKRQGLIKLGNGDKYSLERLLPLIRFHVFNNEIKIYKNFEIGKPLDEVDSKDITKLRLHL